MPALVSAEIMDATWQHIGASSGARVLAMQKECGKHQQELTGFVVLYTSTLSPEAIGLALYAYVVIFQAFKRSGATLRKIGDARILRQWEATGERLANAQASGGRLESLLPSIECSERVVLAYIAGALSQDQEDPVDLTDAEYWHIARVLVTATECLHQAQKTR
jgi:hypothetical protein